MTSKNLLISVIGDLLKSLILIYERYLFFTSAPSSRNASTLTTSDLLALIVMVQNMYPSSVDLDEPSPEVENRCHGNSIKMCLSLFLI